MLLSDKTIIDKAVNNQMITPFLFKQIKEKHYADINTTEESIRLISSYPTLSFGPSSYGYDACLASDGFVVFTSEGEPSAPIDPKNFNTKIAFPEFTYKDHTGEYFILRPRQYAMGLTVETFKLPADVSGLAIGKSTYCRIGLALNTSPLEAGWQGRLVLEMANQTDFPLKVYANEGICQILFFQGDQTCDVSYADRKGKYQDQSQMTYAKV